MDTRDNRFKYMVPDEADKDYMIPFDIGEEIVIKNYRFKVHNVDVNTNTLILKPLGITDELKHLRDSFMKMERLGSKIKNLKAKGGLGF